LQIVGNGPPSRPSYVYQFDLNAPALNPVLIDSTSGVRLSDMQLATDGRIYVARTINLLSKKDSLDVIYNPNRPGPECNYNQLNHTSGNRFSLNGRASIFSLPNYIQSYFDLPAFRWDSVCHGDVTRFRITNTANTDSVVWSFGDGGSSTSLSPMHAYAQPGNYWVKLTSKFNGIGYNDSSLVTSYALPVIGLGDTILLYSGSSINLHAGGGFKEYTWSTGSQDSIITVENQGNYWAKVKDFNCCINSDSVFVRVFEYFIPNAFTPNGDGLNDYFRVVGLYKNIKFKMYLYNRWGQLVFETDDIDKGWDGTSKGRYCDPDSYVWVVNVGFLGQDIITQGDIVLKGTVTLVR
jgi:gliding motility-associated-like protein